MLFVCSDAIRLYCPSYSPAFLFVSIRVRQSSTCKISISSALSVIDLHTVKMSLSIGTVNASLGMLFIASTLTIVAPSRRNDPRINSCEATASKSITLAYSISLRYSFRFSMLLSNLCIWTLWLSLHQPIYQLPGLGRYT